MVLEGVAVTPVVNAGAGLAPAVPVPCVTGETPITDVKVTPVDNAGTVPGLVFCAEDEAG